MPIRVMRGTVVSNKADQTATVLVERRVMHPIYKKFLKKSKKYAAHDPQNKCEVGQTVSIRECPPVSKSKRFEIVYED
ncbi:MAG: 30S ribosomal protein S17 [Alphaproteobacteria bacterium]|jgi:small subunit ribosomal protein S17